MRQRACLLCIFTVHVEWSSIKHVLFSTFCSPSLPPSPSLSLTLSLFLSLSLDHAASHGTRDRVFYENPGEYRHETDGISPAVIRIFCSSRRAHIDRAYFPRDMCHRIHAGIKASIGSRPGGRAAQFRKSIVRDAKEDCRVEKPAGLEARRVLIVEVYLESIFNDPLIGSTVSLSRSLARSFSLSSWDSSAALAKQLIRNVGRRGNVRVKYIYLPSELAFACGAKRKKEWNEEWRKVATARLEMRLNLCALNEITSRKTFVLFDVGKMAAARLLHNLRIICRMYALNLFPGF